MMFSQLIRKAQKNRFGIRNGSGAKNRETKRKIDKTNGGQDLLVALRHVLVERSALHQFVIGVKHDAKLRNVYGGQIFGHVKFLLSVFFKGFYAVLFGPNSLISAHFNQHFSLIKNFGFF